MGFRGSREPSDIEAPAPKAKAAAEFKLRRVADSP
jgi:hypothetical protein